MMTPDAHQLKSLQKQIAQLERQKHDLQKKVNGFEEQFCLLCHKQYDPSSKRFEGQQAMFNEAQ